MNEKGFVGRKEYLEILDTLWADGITGACAVIGRRRIGKSRLIKEFIKDKRSLYIQFIESGISENLAHISSAMSSFMGKDIHYTDLEQFFTELSKEVKKSKMIVVFDEYPYLSETDGTFSSRVQNLIDNELRDSFVIICGSSVSMMEKEVSDSGRPLFGRVRKLYVKEMDFDECREFHPNMPEQDMLALYMTIGGVPYYHIYPQEDTYEGYITTDFFEDTGMLKEEGLNIINCELSPRDEFYRILDSIAEGGTDTGTISTRSGIEITKCKRHLSKLTELGITAKVNPMADAPKKPVHYIIRDSLIAFHFQVLRKCPIGTMDPKRTYEYLRPKIYTFLGRRFEIFCIDRIIRNYDTLDIGKWWGRVHEKDDSGSPLRNKNGKVSFEETDIDIIAKLYSDRNEIMLFAECKYTSSKIGISAVEELRKRMDLVHGNSNSRMMLFSRSGFTDELTEYAEGTGYVYLIGPDELFRNRPFPII